MAKNITTAVAAPTFRAVKDAGDRIQTYIKLLSRKNGASAQELLDAVGAITKHNRWSLERLGAKYGYALDMTKEEGEPVRYVFSKITNGKAPSMQFGKQIAPKGKPTKPAKTVVKKAAAPAKKSAAAKKSANVVAFKAMARKGKTTRTAA